MNLKSPDTLIVAWLLVPAIAALLCAGLGAGLRLVSGLALGALTLPVGFLTGIVLMTLLLELGLSGKATVAVCVVAALIGPALALRRGGLPPRPRLRGAAWPWAAGAGLAAFGVGMAPLVGSARSGVLGYVLNNDSAFHIQLVQRLVDAGADPVTPGGDSFALATQSLETGYPIGGYAWPLVGSALTGVEPFHIWSPLIAVVAAMSALTCFHLLRRVDAPAPFAAVAGATIASGYLPYSYLAQGAGKEVIMPLAFLVAVGLLAAALDRRPLHWRALIPVAVVVAAGVANIGAASLAFAGLALLAWLGVMLVRAWRARDLSLLRPLVPFAVVGALAAVPFVPTALGYVEDFRGEFGQETEIGNLLGDLPLREMLNVWLAGDYRIDRPEADTLTWILVVLAFVLALAGLAYALRRGSFALLVPAAAAIGGSLAITPSVSIYFDAKTYLVIAPALGLLSAAGVLLLARASRVAAALAGAVLVAGVLASAAYVYSDVWNTPRDRFGELADLGERLPGDGPLMVHEREDYATYFLRRLRPHANWGDRRSSPGFRTEVNLPPGLPHTPDFDDYVPDHVQEFELLLERRRPGGSRPPANFAPVTETAHYRVWRRNGAAPLRHLPLGEFGAIDGAERLDCEHGRVRRFVAQARTGRSMIDVALPPAAPRTLIRPAGWYTSEFARVAPAPGQIVARRAYAATDAALPPGRYSAWIQGSIGTQLRFRAGGATVSHVRADLGLPDAWHPVATIDVPADVQTYELIVLGRGRHFAGDRHASLVGPFVLVPEQVAPRIERVSADEVSRFCGTRVDWLEIPAA